jgi:nucleoid DNA-binding protein
MSKKLNSILLEYGYTSDEIGRYMLMLFDSITDILIEHQHIDIRALGVFKLKTRNIYHAGICLPKLVSKSSPHLVIHFKASKRLNAAVINTSSNQTCCN